jgi:ectoine hydroxylase-related dioxygenase (phytanoyl-CoA dioxygenase family)
MQMDEDNVEAFHREGVLLSPNRLSDLDVDILLAELEYLRDETESSALEADGRTVRALHGCHRKSSVFDALTRLPTLLSPAVQLLSAQVYLYQLKVNLKAPFVGDVWPWHQDYSFWSGEDGMPSQRALTAAVFLDDVTEFNGPMYFIPRSHQDGCLDQPPLPVKDPLEWQSNFSSTLRYQTSAEHVAEMVRRFGLLAPKGPRGTVLFFHCNVVHASPSNVSPAPRRIVFITYNSTENLPRVLRRPEFLVERYAEPLKLFPGESLTPAPRL